MKIFVTIMLCGLSVYNGEVFPSVYRGIGYNLVNVIGRIGNVLAPLATPILRPYMLP